jgi:hypothetical protein
MSRSEGFSGLLFFIEKEMFSLVFGSFWWEGLATGSGLCYTGRNVSKFSYT